MKKEKKEKLKKDLEDKQKKELEEKKKNDMEKNKKNNNPKKQSKVNESDSDEEDDFDPRKRLNTNRQTSTKKVYTFECTNIINLQQIIYLGMDSAEIPIILKNTGKFNWPQNKTKLIFDPKSQIKGKSVELKPLESNEEQRFNVVINGLAKLKEGSYDAYVWFNVNGENCGKMLTLRVIIKKKEKDPLEENMAKIEAFRKEFNLDDKKTYSDEYILDALIENDFDFGNTFMKIIG